MKHFIFSYLLIFLYSCTHVPAQTASSKAVNQRLAGLDIYGTDRLTVTEVKSLLGDKLEPCIEIYLAEDYEKFHECKAELVAKLQEKYHFAYLDLSLVGYFYPGDRPVYATFDVVETKDANVRMDFVKRPTKTFADPEGLIQAWDDYQKTGFDLMARGELSGARVECPAFHCIFGHNHPALKSYEKIFVDGVKRNRSALIEIIQFDKDDNRRGIAPYLLAYESDGSELVKVLTPRLRDESEFVRNNIARIFWDIAMFHQELDLPLDEAAKVLNFPATTDRNKASNLFFTIAQNYVLLCIYA